MWKTLNRYRFKLNLRKTNQGKYLTYLSHCSIAMTISVHYFCHPWKWVLWPDVLVNFRLAEVSVLIFSRPSVERWKGNKNLCHSTAMTTMNRTVSLPIQPKAAPSPLFHGDLFRALSIRLDRIQFHFNWPGNAYIILCIYDLPPINIQGLRTVSVDIIYYVAVAYDWLFVFLCLWVLHIHNYEYCTWSCT